ncbi:hypothetical protein DMENIID0001_092100 [Sergentomyia squamirostris]
MPVKQDKQVNLTKAVGMIRKATEKVTFRPLIVCLPEFFNTPYKLEDLRKNAETIPSGETCRCLSSLAKELGIYIFGGSIPELDATQMYNTCTVWSPDGDLIGKYRKLHMSNEGGLKESEVFGPGQCLTTVTIGRAQIGIGICYDIHFEELWRLYRNLNCNLMIIPAAWPIGTGSRYAEVLQRARAVDTQSFVAMISPARDCESEYVTWGFSALIDPNGLALCKATHEEEVVTAAIGMSIFRYSFWDLKQKC